MSTEILRNVVVVGSNEVLDADDDNNPTTSDVYSSPGEELQMSTFADGQTIQLPDGTLAVIKNLDCCRCMLISQVLLLLLLLLNI